MRVISVAAVGFLLTLGINAAAIGLATQRSPVWISGTSDAGVYFDEARWPAVTVRFHTLTRPTGESIVVSVTSIGWPWPILTKQSEHQVPPTTPGTITIHHEWYGAAAILTRPTHVRIWWLASLFQICAIGLMAYLAALFLRWLSRCAWARGRKRRALRGLCPRCNYPLVEVSNRCPECGERYVNPTS